jgi:DNA-binding transcriptional regulator YdaS (Cro superfamily)
MKATNEETKKLINELGGPAFVSRQLNVTPQAVSLWSCKVGIPAERISGLIKIGMARGIKIDLEKIRPDIDWRLIAASVFSKSKKNGEAHV